jgi:hypothetical protein
MREEFLLEFTGFHGCPSRCHIKIISDQTKPVVVMCSQVKSNPGTSIQNAYEIIRERVFNYLSEKSQAEMKERKALVLDELAQTIDSTKKFHIAMIVYLLRYASKKLRGQHPLLDQLKVETPELYWIEHWPEGTGIGYEVNYLLVSENEAGSPMWQRISIDQIANKLGYEPSDFEVSGSDIA